MNGKMRRIKVSVKALLASGELRATWLAALRRAPELARFEACIASPLATALTSPQLARLAHVGERTLRKRVKRATGRTPIELVASMRLDRVAEQLRGTNMSVKSIARREAFASVPAFDHHFTRYFGQSPSAFRHAVLCAKDYTSAGRA